MIAWNNNGLKNDDDDDDDDDRLIFSKRIFMSTIICLISYATESIFNKSRNC